jgi:hypothetical protein
MFGGINATQQLRMIFAELGTPCQVKMSQIYIHLSGEPSKIFGNDFIDKLSIWYRIDGCHCKFSV